MSDLWAAREIEREILCWLWVSISGDLMAISSVWLVEYRGAVPCPVYATEQGFPTCDPWKAKRFQSREAAEAWMHRPEIIGYEEPWHAAEHGFDGDF